MLDKTKRILDFGDLDLDLMKVFYSGTRVVNSYLRKFMAFAFKFHTMMV